MKLPWDLIEGSDEIVPRMAQVEREPIFAALGAILARFCDQEGPAGAPPRCHDCAFRAGTLANETGNVANAFKCAVEGIPFYCHHGEEDGAPTMLCRGWIALAPKEVLAEIAEKMRGAGGKPCTR